MCPNLLLSRQFEITERHCSSKDIQHDYLTTTLSFIASPQRSLHSMAHEEDPLFAISISTDSYASAALESQSSPTVSRTHQTESAFKTIKASYTAKQHNGSLYAELISAVPSLDLEKAFGSEGERIVFGKREQALFGYVVGEMWYDGRSERVIRLCERMMRVGVLEGKFGEAVGRWRGRAEERARSENGVERVKD